MTTNMDTREELRPYRNRKLRFEGVLIDVIQPNSQNKLNSLTYGLVFGSVYAPNEKIELDHVVIKINKNAYHESNVHLFNRYRFTATVESYMKIVKIEGISAQTESYMLIRPNRIEVMEGSSLQQPTRFVKNRIERITTCNTSGDHNTDELYAMIEQRKNNGDVEEFCEKYIRGLQPNKVTKLDMINTLYSKRHSHKKHRSIS